MIFKGLFTWCIRCYCLIFSRKLCDRDGDGRIDADEFCAALWLAERATQGTPVPNTLPSDLIPALSGGSGGAFGSQNSFEDKRKENFERGRMELQRRKREIKEKEEREKVSAVWMLCPVCVYEMLFKIFL